MIKIYSDGACSGNPGPGGWGAVIIDGETKTELSGGESNTTNNRMEMTAVIEALKVMEEKKDIVVTTDSNYVKNGITQWIHGWLKNNWQTAAKKPVKNQDLWKELWELSNLYNIKWEWVKGHSGHPENERCDKLATDQAKKFR